ncbi:uncharacterized protein NPIL_175521, partial [Nephila pilipes]
MDYSNYPKDHDLFNLSNEGRLGALKNETCEPIKEFVALKYTDSLYLEIKAPNVYTEVKNNFSDIMDYSNYPKDHDLFNLSNEGRLGALKNETCEPIKEFVALK